MQNKIKLSILIPCYNREKTIGRCLASAVSCTYRDIEIIVSDNASTDGSLRLINDYAAKDNRIRVLTSDKNVGPIPNWRKALDAASGEYVHWLWSDDWVVPGFYEEAFLRMEEDGSHAVITAIILDTRRFRRSFVAYSKNIFSEKGPHACDRVLSFDKSPQSPAACILNRDSVKRHFYTEFGWLGCPNIGMKGFGTDSLMIAGALMEADIVSYINIPYVHFTDSADSITRTTKGRESGTVRYIAAHLWFLSEIRHKLRFRAVLMLMAKSWIEGYTIAIYSVVWLRVKASILGWK